MRSMNAAAPQGTLIEQPPQTFSQQQNPPAQLPKQTRPRITDPVASQAERKKAQRPAIDRRIGADLDPILASAPTNRHGRRLRKRYLKYRDNLFTFLTYPEAPADNNASERDLRPMAMYRKVTGGFRSGSRDRGGNRPGFSGH